MLDKHKGGDIQLYSVQNKINNQPANMQFTIFNLTRRFLTFPSRSHLYWDGVQLQVHACVPKPHLRNTIEFVKVGKVR